MLTPRHQRFVAEYLKDLNATQAAIRAGYAAKNADVTGPRLLRNVGIAKAVAESQGRQLQKAELTASMVKERLRQIAFQDIRQLFDARGDLRPITELDDNAAAIVGGLEVIKKNAQAGDGVIDTIHKVKVIDPVKALEMLAKHFGLLEEKVSHSGEIRIIHELADD